MFAQCTYRQMLLRAARPACTIPDVHSPPFCHPPSAAAATTTHDGEEVPQFKRLKTALKQAAMNATKTAIAAPASCKVPAAAAAAVPAALKAPEPAVPLSVPAAT